MSKTILFMRRHAQATCDGARWDESKHKRDNGGRFSSTGGGGGKKGEKSGGGDIPAAVAENLAYRNKYYGGGGTKGSRRPQMEKPKPLAAKYKTEPVISFLMKKTDSSRSEVMANFFGDTSLLKKEAKERRNHQRRVIRAEKRKRLR